MSPIIPAIVAALALPGVTDCSYPADNCVGYGARLYQPTDTLLICLEGVPGSTAVVLHSQLQTPAWPLGNGELCLSAPARGALTTFDELYGQAAFPFTLAEIPVGSHVQIMYRDCDSNFNLSNRREIVQTGVE